MSSRGSFGFLAGAVLSYFLYGCQPPPAASPGGRLLRLLSPPGRPTLHYFDVRGRGEAIRMALYDANGARAQVCPAPVLRAPKERFPNEPYPLLLRSERRRFRCCVGVVQRRFHGSAPPCCSADVQCSIL